MASNKKEDEQYKHFFDPFDEQNLIQNAAESFA